jgi:hypothetical protein
MWASAYPAVHRVIVPVISWEPRAHVDWRSLVPRVLDVSDVSREWLTFFPKELDRPGVWQDLSALLNPLSPILFGVVLMGDEIAPIAANLERLLGLYANPVALLMPLGSIGSSLTLEAALAVCRAHPHFRLAALREISPFLAKSELGIIYHQDNVHIPGILGRIRDLYVGNFSFLGLLEANTALHLQHKKYKNQDQINGHSAERSSFPVATGEGRSRWSRATDRLTRMLGRSAYKVEYLRYVVPDQMQAGMRYEATVELRNRSASSWLTAADSESGVNIAYHWTTLDGMMLVKEGIRSRLPWIVRGGEAITTTFKIATPDRPGPYILQLDLVHEGITWFSEAGSPGPAIPVEVVEAS